MHNKGMDRTNSAQSIRNAAINTKTNSTNDVHKWVAMLLSKYSQPTGVLTRSKWQKRGDRVRLKSNAWSPKRARQLNKQAKAVILRQHPRLLNNATLWKEILESKGVRNVSGRSSLKRAWHRLWHGRSFRRAQLIRNPKQRLRNLDDQLTFHPSDDNAENVSTQKSNVSNKSA